jgi:tRNA U55 pseudouridine synthase TruB
MTNTDRDILRHYLAVLAYRTQKAVREAPSGYLDFQAGHGVRSPREVLDHMTQLMAFAAKRVTGSAQDVDKQDPVERFHEALGQLSTVLQHVEMSSDTVLRLLQGPLADAMTHVGQLAMLRRMAESPIVRESFYEANIKADNTSASQPLEDD